MAAAVVDIIFEQGATFNVWLIYQPDGTVIDTAGFSGRCHVRPEPGHPTLIADFSTSNGGMILGIQSVMTEQGPTDVNIQLTMSAADAAMIVPVAGFDNAVYDIKLISGSTEYRAFEGLFFIHEQVTP